VRIANYAENTSCTVATFPHPLASFRKINLEKESTFAYTSMSRTFTQSQHSGLHDLHKAIT